MEELVAIEMREVVGAPAGSLSGVVVTQNANAIERRTKLIARGEEIEAVTTDGAQRLAAEFIRDAKAVLDEVESNRVKVKAPVLQLGKRIDEEAHKFIHPLLKEISRVTTQANAYATRRAREVEEEQRRQAAEARRLEQERLAAIEAGDEAEAKQLEQQQAQTLVGVPIVTKPAGTAMLDDPVFELVDILAVWAARPDLCNRPTLNVQAVKRAIREGMTECPGLADIALNKKMSVRS